MDELKKIIVAVVITAIIGGFSTYVQVSNIALELRHLQAQVVETNDKLSIVNQNKTDLQVRGLWMQGIDAIVSELRKNNTELNNFAQENRERIIRNEFKIEELEKP